LVDLDTGRVKILEKKMEFVEFFMPSREFDKNSGLSTSIEIKGKLHILIIKFLILKKFYFYESLVYFES